MKIYHSNFDARLGREFIPLPHPPRERTSYLLLVHPSNTTVASLRTSLQHFLSDPQCKYVLCIKGARFVGLSSETHALELEKEFGGRVHFLRYAVSDTNQSSQALRHILAFLDDVEIREMVDWRTLYSAALPRLETLWAKLMALPYLPSDAARKWRADLAKEMPLWKSAELEYREFTGNSFPLPVTGIQADSLEDWRNTIAGCLAETKIAAGNKGLRASADLYQIVSSVLPYVVSEPIAASMPSQQENIAFLRYSQWFSFLWSFPAWLEAWLQKGPRTLMIYWDHIPPDPLFESCGLADYLTPIDFLIALSLTTSRSDSRWRLLVLDGTSHEHENAPAVRLMRTVEPSRGALTPWFRFFPSLDLAALYATLKEQNAAHGMESDLGLWKRIWAASLVDPGHAAQRHAIVNLIAPMLLLSNWGAQPSRTTPQVAALNSLLLRLGLREPAFHAEPGPWVLRETWKPFIDRVVLLEDLDEAGWGLVLKHALGAEENEMTVLGNPVLWTSMLNSDDRILVFLDLRLFSRSCADHEFEFYQNLLQQALSGSLALPVLEAEQAQEAIRQRSSHHPGYDVCLTLLPRLLASLEPTLPIVIFSSTGRKEIIRLLKDYPNIVIDFDKPRFFGDSSSSTCLDTRQSFGRALDKALPLAHARAVQLACRNWSCPLVPSRDFVSSAYVEIYFDESGYEGTDSLFSVGGMALVYRDSASVLQLEEALTREGVRWSVGEPHIHVDSGTFDYEHYLRKVAHAFHQTGTLVFGFSLVHAGTPSPPAKCSGFLADEQFDHLYRNMLEESLESMVFDCLGEMTVSCMGLGVHLPTRILPLPDGMSEIQMIQNWGAEIHTEANSGLDKPDRKFYRVSMANDGRRVLAAALARRAATGSKIPIHMARAVRLQEHVRPAKNRPAAREIHYLADWLARFGRWPFSQVPPTAQQWFVNGFLCHRDVAYANWLECGRASDRGDMAKAIWQGWQALNAEPESPAALGRHFNARLKTWARDLSAQQFYQLWSLVQSGSKFTKHELLQQTQRSGA